MSSRIWTAREVDGAEEDSVGYRGGEMREHRSPPLINKRLELAVTAQDLPSVDYLRQRLRHDPETGKMYHTSCGAMPGRFLPSYVGREAFTVRGGSGYLHGKIAGRSILAHRVIWALHHGEWPTARLIHINGDRTDNRIANLRLENTQDRARGSRTAGSVGVTFDKASGKWRAQFQARGVIYRLGAFSALEDAVSARRAAEIEHKGKA